MSACSKHSRPTAPKGGSPFAPTNSPTVSPAYAGTAAFGKTRIGPMPARLRPVRGGSEQPRRAHGVYDVAPGEWISVPVPPLVDEELFEAAREQLAENRRRHRQHARGQRYLLQGLVVCQQCGYAYYGKAISLG